jgi:hypothetical protein
MYLWSDKDGSSDTCQSFTRLLILFLPCVKSMTSFLLHITLPWLRILRFKLTKYSMSVSPLGLVLVLPHESVHWHRTQGWVAFSCCSSSPLTSLISLVGSVCQRHMEDRLRQQWAPHTISFTCYPHRRCFPGTELQQRYGINMISDKSVPGYQRKGCSRWVGQTSYLAPVYPGFLKSATSANCWHRFALAALLWCRFI